MVSGALLTVSVKSFVKGIKSLLPSCEAVMVAVPEPLIVSVLPLTVATFVSLDVQASVCPSLVVAGSVNGASP